MDGSVICGYYPWMEKSYPWMNKSHRWMKVPSVDYYLWITFSSIDVNPLMKARDHGHGRSLCHELCTIGTWMDVGNQNFVDPKLI